MLNQQQLAAVEYTASPLLVLAGAGCGKTRVITEKMAFLVNHRLCASEHIYAITFTNKAAKEMKQRAISLVAGGDQIKVSTFHALGLRILREEVQKTNYHPGFSILDGTETHKILKELLPSGIKKEIVSQLQWQISSWKNAGLLPQDVVSKVPMATQLYDQYLNYMKHINALDFDDLILQSLHLLTTQKETRQHWQQQISYLMVDEYQDTNACQYQLLKSLIGKDQHLTCVGDDDQSIYGWRGAQSENLQLLQQDFPTLKVQKLEQNYRSSSTILKAANAVVLNNPHPFTKQIWSELGQGEAIKIRAYQTPEEEAVSIINEIMFKHRVDQISYNNFAILYRSNHQAKLFEQQLRVNNIPYQISGGRSFFDYTEIKDMLAYLRLLVNPKDNAAFLRIINTPRRGIGLQTVKHITHIAGQKRINFLQAAQDHQVINGLTDTVQNKLLLFTAMIKKHQQMKGSPYEIASSIFKAIDLVSWVETNANNKAAKINKVKLVKDCLKWIESLSRQKAKDLDELLSFLSIQTGLESEEESKSGIQIMTLHAAKGLEFSRVYLVGVEEGILPHRNSLSDDAENNTSSGVEEERRLMYVGMTRAMNSLSISFAKKRKNRFDDSSNTLASGPSRFIDEIPLNLSSGHPAEQKTEAQIKQQNKDNFAAMIAMLKNK